MFESKNVVCSSRKYVLKRETVGANGNSSNLNINAIQSGENMFTFLQFQQVVL